MSMSCVPNQYITNVIIIKFTHSTSIGIKTFALQNCII